MSLNIAVAIKKMNPQALLPSYQSIQSAGMDMSACIDAPIVIAAHERAIVPTGLAIALPAGFEAQIRARSGLAAKFGIMPANGIGTIDADYRGEIGIILLNTSNQDFTVEPGMRIAQMIVTQYNQVDWQLVDELDKTKRGSDGFGSTGV